MAKVAISTHSVWLLKRSRSPSAHSWRRLASGLFATADLADETTLATDAGMPSSTSAASRNEIASTTTMPFSPKNPAITPPNAGPTSRERLLLRELSAFAGTSCSSVTSAGNRAFCAGTVNCSKQVSAKMTM